MLKILVYNVFSPYLYSHKILKYVKQRKTQGAETHAGQDREGFWQRQCDDDE